MKKRAIVAVLVSVVLHQVLGYLWYAVLPFAPARIAALGLPASEISTVAPTALAIDLIGWIAASIVLVWLVARMDIRTAAGGAGLGFLLWLGVALPAIAPHYAFAHLPASVTLIDLGNSLVTLAISGAVVGALSHDAIPAR